MSSSRFREEAFGDDVAGFSASRDPLLAGGDKEVWLKIWHEQSSSGMSRRPSCSVMVYASVMVAFGVISTVSMPVYVDSLAAHPPGSDPYFVATLVSTMFAVAFGIIVTVTYFTTDLLKDSTSFPHSQMALIGLCSGCSGTLSMFATPTDRTSGFLQAILGSFVIPITVAVRFLVLRRGVTWKQGVAAGAVTAGVLLSLGPTLAGSASARGPGHAVGAGRVLWPLLFMLSSLPVVLASVLTERWLQPARPQVPSLTRRNMVSVTSSTLDILPVNLEPAVADDDFGWSDMAQRRIWDSPAASRKRSYDRSPRQTSTGSRRRALSFSGVVNVRASTLPTPAPADTSVSLVWFLFWVNTYQLAAVYGLFWLDLLPGFGMSRSLHELGARLSFGWRCTLAAAEGCDADVTMRGVTAAFSTIIAGALTSVLIRHSDGAIFNAIAQTVVAPVSALFWALFIPSPLTWRPRFTDTTGFSIAGLALILPAMYVYHRLSDQGLHAAVTQAHAHAQGPGRGQSRARRSVLRRGAPASSHGGSSVGPTTTGSVQPTDFRD